MRISKAGISKSRKVYILVFAIVMMVAMYFLCQLLNLLLIKKNLEGDGKCHITLKCQVSDSVNNYIPYLHYIGIDVKELKLVLDKDENKYYGKLYVNDGNRIAMEFYKDDEDMMVNISGLISYIAYENRDILPDKLVDMLDNDKDIYMTTDAIEELVGSSDMSVSEEILKIVDIQGSTSLSLIKKNIYSRQKYMPALKFSTGKTTNIKVNSSIWTFFNQRFFIRGVRSNNGKENDFQIKYEKDNKIKVRMPDNSISKMEVVVIKKLLKEIVSKYN
jgi:hypothetical protein